MSPREPDLSTLAEVAPPPPPGFVAMLREDVACVFARDRRRATPWNCSPSTPACRP
jgi:hypothetical protein